MRKFDFIFGNPPYTNTVDLKIHKVLQECLSECGRIVFVHPSQFLLSHKPGVRKTGGRDIDKNQSSQTQSSSVVVLDD